MMTKTNKTIMKKDVVSFSVTKKTDLVATCTTKGLDPLEIEEALGMFKAALKESHIEWDQIRVARLEKTDWVTFEAKKTNLEIKKLEDK